MNDGSIRIETSIDNTGISGDLSELDAMVERAKRKIETSIGGVGIALTDTQRRKQIAALSKQLDDVLKQYDALIAKEQETRESLGPLATMQFSGDGGTYLENNTDYQQLIGQIDQTFARAQALQETIESLENGTYGVNLELYKASNEGVKDVKEGLEKAKEEMTKANRESMSFRKTIQDSSFDANRLGTYFERIKRKILQYAGALLGIRGIYSLLRRAASAYISSDSDLQTQLASTWTVLGEMLAPIINWIINLISTAIGYINVFYKALTGIDAIANANQRAMDKQADAIKGVGGAAAKAEAQLAGFDEMNRLSAESSGGGGGGSAADISDDLFKTPELDEKLVKKIKDLAKWLKESWEFVALIGAGLLAWRIANKLGLNLSKTAGALLAILGFAIGISGAFDAWENGVDWKNLLKMVGGFALGIGGVYKAFQGSAFQNMATGIAAAAAGIGLMVVGFRDLIQNGATAENLLLIAAGIEAIALAVALLTENYFAAAVIAVTGLITGLAGLGLKINEVEEPLYNLTEKEKEIVKAADAATESFYKQQEALRSSVQDTDIIYGHYDKLWDELQKLADESGHVADKDRDRAQVIINELNEALGLEIEMTDGVIQKYQDLKTSIAEVIEQKKYEALSARYAEDYADAIIAEAKASDALKVKEKALNDARAAYFEKEQQAEKIRGEIRELARAGHQDEAEALGRENQELFRQEEALKRTYDAAKLEYREAADEHQDMLNRLDRQNEAAILAEQGRFKEATEVLLERKRYINGAMTDISYEEKQQNLANLKAMAEDAKEQAEDYKRKYEGGLHGYTYEGLVEAKAFAKEAQKAFDDAEEAFKKIGENMAAGLKKGFQNKESEVLDTVGTVAFNAAKRARNALGVQSPSKVFMAIGEYVGEGLAIGIDRSTVSIVSSIDKQIDAMTQAYDSAEFGYELPEIPDVPPTELGAIRNIPQGAMSTRLAMQMAGIEGIAGADELSDSPEPVSIPIYLDGKLIAKYTYDINQRREFALNGVI